MSMKHTPGPGPCVWNGNEIVSAAEPNKVVAGLAPDAPDEWGPLFAAAPEMYHLLLQLERLGDALEPRCLICGRHMDDGHTDWCDIGTVLRKARGEASSTATNHDEEYEEWIRRAEEERYYNEYGREA